MLQHVLLYYEHFKISVNKFCVDFETDAFFLRESVFFL